MDTYEVFRDIAIILVAAKFCGLAARQLHMPSVVGNIIAGLLIGPCVLNLVQPSDFLSQMAEIGVVLLMFSAGLESDTKEIIRSGPKAPGGGHLRCDCTFSGRNRPVSPFLWPCQYPKKPLL